MNKTEIILSISEKTGISIPDCEKVMNAFEQVLKNELSQKNTGSVIDKMIKLLNYVKSSIFASQ